MKKIYNKLLIVAIICGVLSAILCCLSAMNYKFDFPATNNVVNETINLGSDNPGSGWYLLFAGGAGLAVDFAGAVATLLLILLIPCSILLAIIISQGIARLVQIGMQKRWKNITAKTFTYISITLQIVLCLMLLFLMMSNLSCNKILLLLALIANVICVVLFIKELKKSKKICTEIIE